MPVADSRHFSREHVETHTFNASSELAEQAIHCLELVAELSTEGLSYQFKGGNSLLLVLDRPRRFSIDVDIATDSSREEIEACLDRLVERHGVFVRWDKRQHKTKPWLPIASYYLYYRSHFSDSSDTNIMLDVQLRRSPYRTERKKVVCGELFAAEADVELPLASSIIGDKLLTVGPYTLGIPVGKGKEAQRLKHVYDVSALMATGPDLTQIRESFEGCLEHENSLQERKSDSREVMLDTVAFCASVALHEDKPAPSPDHSRVLAENIAGLDAFAAHLFEPGYGWRNLQLDTARVAYCIAAVCSPSVDAASFAAALRGALRGSEELLPKAVLAANAEARTWWARTAQVLDKNPFGLQQ